MSDKHSFRLVGDSGRYSLQGTYEDFLVDTFEKDGDVYGVTRDMLVLRRFRILNLRMGEWGYLWLDKVQTQQYKDHLHKDHLHNIGDPRLLALPKTGITFPKGQPQLKCNDHSHSGASLVRDHAGGLWKCGYDLTGLIPFIDKKSLMKKGSDGYLKDPEMCFAFPWLSYLGHEDDKEFWAYNRDGEKTTRYTIGTYKVLKLIEDAGMWGHYFPSKEEWEDEEKAKAACAARKEELMSTKLSRLKEVQQELRDLEQENTRLRGDVSKAQAAQAKAEARLAKIEEGLPERLEERVIEAEKRAAAAEARAKAAEETLEAARKENEGWDWSLFMGSDE